ncbi:hypothetical protein LCGC14_2094650 [marine sediment metagenome]|uniref:Uncharacterized protein n=1 Tax=marine sediment metagenome TaxID=412755 RepID=A0A0F9H8I2_9ZZZZ
MALMGLRRESRRLGYKSKSAGPWDEGEPNSKYKSGTGACGHYDVELDAFGNCRDEECRRDRLTKALHSGEAVRAPNGTIIWTPGHKIRKDL